jgi:hypothetical protein
LALIAECVPLALLVDAARLVDRCFAFDSFFTAGRQPSASVLTAKRHDVLLTFLKQLGTKRNAISCNRLRKPMEIAVPELRRRVVNTVVPVERFE